MTWEVVEVWTPYASFWVAQCPEPLAWGYMRAILTDCGGYLAACWRLPGVPDLRA